MYQDVIIARILLAVGIGFLIFSQVFGWVSFSVPDWLQCYERNNSIDINSSNVNTTVLKKFGLWQICTFITASNDFNCTSWKGNIPTFVELAQVLIPFGLSFGCLSLVLVCLGVLCRRAYAVILLFASLCAFLSFVLIIIGLTVFAVESAAYVARLRLDVNESPRRWGLWLLLPDLVLSFLASICFVVASLLYWCDYRNMQVAGILNHGVDKYDGSVFKAFSDNNTTTAIKQRYPYQDYSNTCYQMNGLNNNNNNNQQNLMGYPPPPSYNGMVNSGYQPTPPGMFGYSRPGSPTMNPMYPYTNMDPYYPRHYMTETSEMDEYPRASRSRRRSRSRRQSEHRSRSNSPHESTSGDNNNQKQTQYIPIPVPYYHPQATQAAPATQASAQQKLQTPVTMMKNNPSTISYMVPQTKQQYKDDNLQTPNQPANNLNYNNLQQSVLVPNATQPVYTIAYRANNNGNALAPNILTGAAATTYVTATRSQIGDITSFNSDSDKDDDNNYQSIAKRANTKKININEAWTWRKM